MSVSTNISNGNIWLPYVRAYIPLDESDRAAMSNLVWHARESKFDKSGAPSKTTELHADGIIRQYQFKLNIPISLNQEVGLNFRMFSLDPGKIPYSLLTSDQFIEWFHSNIYGGDDPFARNVYDYNQAFIHYKDENDKTFQMNKGDFIFSGIDLSYYAYPRIDLLEERNIHANLGLQLGANLSKINPSLDLGLNSTAIKRIEFKENKSMLHLGLSIGILRQNIINSVNRVQLSNRKYLLSSELFLEYVKQIKNRSYFSIATTWFIQSSYFKKRDFDFLVLTGERISSHWHYAGSHLYRPLSANTLSLTFGTGDIAFWVYLREDFHVDNAPDAQTGIGLKVYFR